MVTSTFKSTSRRTLSSTPTQQQQQTPQNPTQKAPLRRSRSVSAFPSTHLDITSDFHNKRDNPLFWVDGSPSSDGKDFNFDEISSNLIDPPAAKGPIGDGEGSSRRGRSVSRNSGGKERNFQSSGPSSGRSLSRVDTGRRRRSPSRGHSGNSEREKDRGSAVLPNFSSKSKVRFNASHSSSEEKTKLGRSTSDLSELLKGSKARSNLHSAFETEDDSAVSVSGSRTSHWEDARSTSSSSEAEEKTIKPNSEENKISHLKEDNDANGGILETVRTEVRRAISDMQHDFKNAMLRTNSDVTSSSILSDIASELANPSAVDFTSDIRGEYAKELEECEERARKLRAELAIEEHRGLELNKILSDIIPEPKTPQTQKPRAVRKASLERRKMSRRLEEEAMAYFDECVSISTFDDSDFSSLEDPPTTTARFTDTGDGNMTAPGVSSKDNLACLFESQGHTRKSPPVQCNENSSLAANSCHDSAHSSNQNSVKQQFSFLPKPSRATSLEYDIRNYVKSFSKSNSERESCNSQIVSVGHRNTEDYASQLPMEKFLLDRVTFRSRIESGSMVLCGGGFGFPVSSFSSFL